MERNFRACKKKQTRLIVNADDFGYFDCVSQGIIHGAKAGVITATGIMANCVDFQKRLSWLADVSEIDAGVHLNITHGEPLSPDMSRQLFFNQGKFVSKFEVIKALLTGRLDKRAILEEFRLQIERCLSSDIKLYFLNSHEHLHMLPTLFSGTQSLAEEYDIPFVRLSAPEWRMGGMDGLVRNVLMEGMGWVNKKRVEANGKHHMLGMGVSGRLDFEYLGKLIPLLRPGRIYELMCHPGFFDQQEIVDEHILHYHRWQEELDALLHPDFSALCKQYRVRLTRYRDL